MGIFDSLGSFWDWLTTQNPGGSAGGTPYLGAGSPTASTQTPIVGPLQGSPMLGGQPQGGGFLSGLLGGQQPALASYFQPQGGGLLGFGNTPLGGIIRGSLEGLGSATGVGGLSGVGVAAMGAGQAEQQRRQNQMNAVLAGQQYQAGQYGLVGDVLKNQQMLQMINYRRHLSGQDPVTMDQLLADPTLAQTNLPGQAVATAAPSGQPAATGTAVPATGGGTVTIPGTTYSLPGTQRTLPSGSQASIPGQQVTIPSMNLDQLKQVIARREGGVDAISGAIGGLTQGTFNQYANPGESFSNPQDRAAVADRLIADLAAKSGGDPAKIAQGDYTGVDPARVAVGWFSGGGAPHSQTDTGNIAPLGAAVPWNYDAHDAHGTTTSGYVASIAKLAGQPPAQGQQPAMAPGATGQAQQPAVSVPQSLPMTIPEIEASNLPDWAKMSLENALYSADPAEISKAYSTVGQYLAAPGQAAQTAVTTEQLTDPLKYGSQQAQYERATKIRDDYQANKTVQRYAIAKPAADAFEAAYNSRGGPAQASDYALVEAALQVLNPDVAVAKPGTAEYATQLQTLPGQAAAAIQKAFDTKSAIEPGAVEQLKAAVEQRMAVNNKLIGSVNKSFGDRAKKDAPQIDPSYWNPEGWGMDQGATQTTSTGGQTTSTDGQPATTPSKTTTGPKPWPKEHPATIASGASSDAEIAWIDSLPIGSWFINPADGKPVQKLQQRSGYTGKGQSSGYQGP